MQHENEELYQRIQTDLLYFILVADIVIAEMTNKFTRTTLKTLDYLNNSSLESNDDPAPIIKTSFIAIDNSLHFLRTVFNQTITLHEQ